MKKKFDVIVGNPPYQDGSMEGGQNKLYNLFSKKAIELADIISFITPTQVTKPSKRFSLVGCPGLKNIDFTVDDDFDVGVKICSWLVEKDYIGDVTVKYNGGEKQCPVNKPFYDFSIVDLDVISIYEGILEHTLDIKKTKNRMFKRNNHGPAFNNHETDKHIYPIHSTSRGTSNLVFTSREPVGYKQKKLIVSNTKSLTEENILITDKDYGPSYFCYIVKDDNHIDNIKSFLLSDYFIELSNKFRSIRGGMNSVLIDYCPKFDANKSWTNKEVEEFFDEFRNI